MSLRFLGKVAFVSNLFFVAALVLRYNQFVFQQDVSSYIILLGWLIAPLLNIGFALGWLLGKKYHFPQWIGIANIFFLLVQIYLFFKLH